MVHVTEGLLGNQTRRSFLQLSFLPRIVQSASGQWKSNNEGTSDQLFSGWESWAGVAATSPTKCHWFCNGGYAGFIPPSGKQQHIWLDCFPLSLSIVLTAPLLPALLHSRRCLEYVWQWEQEQQVAQLDCQAASCCCHMTYHTASSHIASNTTTIRWGGGEKLNCFLFSPTSHCSRLLYVACSTIILWAILVPFRLLDAIQSADYHL